MIEFVSYDGCYPNLCSGDLIVKIDGVEHTFGGYGPFEDEHHYPKFWESGGSVSFDDEWCEHISQGPWILMAEKGEYPTHIYDLLPKILKVMNKNVPHGCCGGCV